MNNRQKETQQHFLNSEKEVMKQLENSYNQSLKTINDKISKLQFDIDGLNEVYDWLDDGDPEKIKIKSQIQSKIYQKRYQQALQGQVDDILDKLHTQNYTAVNAYLSGCYNDGYIATMYDLHGQGIPLIMPIDQESVVKAVQLDSKISTTLYTRMGENVDALKKSIAAEVSRGIVTGATYAQVAQQIKLKMTGTYNTKGGAYGRALTIARTEGHRIQVQAGMDACIKAKEMGCDVVKQWDSTLDGKTRPSHRAVDGEIRELEKPFSNNLMFPGDSKGKAGEVVNCRCALLQRAKWALDEDELQTLKERAEYYGLDKAENFEDFKEKYLKATGNINNSVTNGHIESDTINKKDDAIEAIKSQSWFKDQLNENEQEDILRALDTATEGERKFWAVYGEKVKGDLHSKGGGYYSPATRTVHLGIGKTDERSKRVGFDRTDVRLFFHETGHLFDYNVMDDGSRIRDNLPDLKKKLRTDVLGYINGVFTNNNLPTTKKLSGFSFEQRRLIMQDLRDDVHLKNAVSDLFGGISGKQLEGGYGHAKSYWKGDALETEAIAHMFEAKFMKGERLEVFKKYFPNSYGYFDEFIEKGVEQKL